MVDGVAKGDFFGFAASKEGNKYLDFKYYEQVFTLDINSEALLIECATAAKYKADHAQPLPVLGGNSNNDNVPRNTPETQEPPPSTDAPQKKTYKSFYGTVTLDPATGLLQCKNIYEELISLFTTKPGVKVTVKLDIEAETETFFDDNTIRAVKENSSILKLESSEFNED